jgi:hypothetical protein
MTVKELIIAVIDANEAGRQKLAVFEPELRQARRNKKGVTTLTFEVRQDQFTPEDALTGIKTYLIIGTLTALQDLVDQSEQELHR